MAPSFAIRRTVSPCAGKHGLNLIGFRDAIRADFFAKNL
jgi:hypothetical protein